MLPKEPYKKVAVLLLYFFSFGLLCYLFFGYLWSALLPFVLAYVFAEFLKPLVKYGEKNKKFPTRLAVLSVIFVSTGAVFFLLFALGKRLASEISQLAQQLGSAISRIQSDDSYAYEMIRRIDSFVPFADLTQRLWDIRKTLGEKLAELALSLAEKMSGSVFLFLGDVIRLVPKALLMLAAFVVSAYYFAVDRVTISKGFLSLFPKSTAARLKKTKDELWRSVFEYLRAYGLIFVITFGELLVLFLLLDTSYSFVLALTVAVVDILPVVGTGTVLIPWGAYCLLTGDAAKGLGLLAGYTVITVVRQIIEPRIVGKFIGLHPLAALAAMYLGLELLGVTGLFVFPLLLILVSRIVKKPVSFGNPPEKRS